MPAPQEEEHLQAVAGGVCGGGEAGKRLQGHAAGGAGVQDSSGGAQRQLRHAGQPHCCGSAACHTLSCAAMPVGRCRHPQCCRHRCRPSPPRSGCTATASSLRWWRWSSPRRRSCWHGPRRRACRRTSRCGRAARPEGAPFKEEEALLGCLGLGLLGCVGESWRAAPRRIAIDCGEQRLSRPAVIPQWFGPNVSTPGPRPPLRPAAPPPGARAGAARRRPHPAAAAGHCAGAEAQGKLGGAQGPDSGAD
jgi:hypothetical protein